MCDIIHFVKEFNCFYDGVLPCGGKGSRLSPINNDDRPKSLFPVNGKELITYSLDNLKPEVVGKLIFAIDYKAAYIREWLKSQNLPYKIIFSEQTEPGVLGAITSAASKADRDDFIACNTDEIRHGLDLEKVLRFHNKHNRLATMVAAYSNNLHRHRVLDVCEETGSLVSSKLKPKEYRVKPEAIGVVNTGFIVFNKRALEHSDFNHSKDWGGIIDPLCEAGQMSVFVDKRIAYFNVGTPEEYLEAENFLKQMALTQHSTQS